MRYCPNCGAEYLGHVQVCADCNVALADAPLDEAPEPAEKPEADELIEVHRTGRLIDAEIVRSYLESNGVKARVNSTGLGVWRAESALPEMTGVPNDFGAHRVVVLEDDVEEAQRLLREVEQGETQPRDAQSPSLRSGSLATAAIVAVVVIVILLNGRPG